MHKLAQIDGIIQVNKLHGINEIHLLNECLIFLFVSNLPSQSDNELVISWEKIMGKTIAKRTQKIFIKDKKLFVKLNSAPLKSELIMSKSKIMALFFQEFGEAVVDDIIFL